MVKSGATTVSQEASANEQGEDNAVTVVLKVNGDKVVLSCTA